MRSRLVPITFSAAVSSDGSERIASRISGLRSSITRSASGRSAIFLYVARVANGWKVCQPISRFNGRPLTCGRRSRSVGDGVVDQAQHLAPRLGCVVVLGQPEADRAAGLRRELAHPGDLAFGRQQVLTHHPGRSQLDDAGAELAEYATDTEELVLRGEGAGDRLAVDGRMQLGTRGREAERARPDPGAHDLGHPRDVFRGRGLVAGAALTHHVRAHCPVRHLGRDIERSRHPVERVEVVGESLPAPLDALRERGAGDVLDALHQLDQPALATRAYRCEADTAVAHHDRRDAVPRRRGQQRIPADLAVVVSVDVDEAGGDQQSFGVDGPASGRPREIADLGDDAVVHGDICRPLRSSRPVDEIAATDNEVVHESSGRCERK